MLDPNDQTLLPLAAASRLIPGRRGKRISLVTLHRWCSHGLRGVYLEFAQVGGQRCTSPAMLARFFAKLTAQSSPTPAPPPKPSPTSSRVKAELDSLGI